MMSIREIIEAGGRLMSDAEKSQRKIAADISAKEKEFGRRVAGAKIAYDAAVKEFELTPSADSKRRLDEAAHELRLARGQQANIMGEPSDFVSRGMTIPGAGGLLSDRYLMDPLLKAIVGGTPMPSSPNALPPLTLDYEKLLRK
jgi:hypothetical protein